MSIGYHDAAQIRAAEAATGERLTSGALMRRAAAGLATVIARELTASGGCYGRSVGLVVGTGDNGGDTLFAGAQLARRGVQVTAVPVDPDRIHRGGLTALRRAGGRVADALPSDASLVVDGVVGLGGHGPLRDRAAQIFAGCAAPVVAVDVPSGIDSDTGMVHTPSVQAKVTVTFGAYRAAHLLAAPSCGRIELVDIGLGDPGRPALVSLTDVDVASAWPVPGPHDDKYSQGVVGVAAGSARYPGAAVLCTGGAIAATSGMTRYAGSAASDVLAHYPETVAAATPDDAGRVQAWVIGPGLGLDDDARDRLRQVLSTDVPVLVDADGLTLVAQSPELLSARTAPTLLTPHAGEFERLAGEPVGDDRAAAVRALADRLGASVLLKGRVTLVAEPGEPVVTGNDARNSWAATAGAGDVLAGVAGALLAAGCRPGRAGAMAARVHALAAETAAADAPLSASRLLTAVPTAIGALRRAAGAPMVREYRG